MLASLMRSACKAMYFSGAVAALRRLHRNKARILMYHSVDHQTALLPSALNVKPRTFKQHMAYLHEKYRVLPLSAMLSISRQGKPFPPHSVVLTFDDGLANNAKYAAPVLKKYGLHASFFVVGQCLQQKRLWLHRWYALQHAVAPERVLATLSQLCHRTIRTVRHGTQIVKYTYTPAQREKIMERLEREFSVRQTSAPASRSRTRDYLTPRDVAKLRKQGHEIGYHTYSHTPLAGLSRQDIAMELVQSKKRAERLIGPLPYFAYPFGEKRSLGKMQNLLSKQYTCALTTVEGFVKPGDDPYTLRRLSVVEGPLSTFAATLEGGRALAANAFQRVTEVFE